MLLLEKSLEVLLASSTFVCLGLGLTAMILWTKRCLFQKQSLSILINETMAKSAWSRETLLTSLSRENIRVPSPCGGKGACKQCKVKISDGAEEPNPSDLATFSKKELQKGWRLSCQYKLKHPIKIEVEAQYLDVKTYQAKVKSNQNVASFIKELVLEVPEKIDYRSGGYFQFHVPPYTTKTNDWKSQIDPIYQDAWEQFGLFEQNIHYTDLEKDQIIRAYSTASYPAEAEKLLFNIRIASPPISRSGKIETSIPWGICSSYLFSLQPGQTVEISGPYGESYMINDERELIFLIGGAGSSFARSHILHLFYSEQTKRKVSLWYGARSLKENIYQKEYEALEKTFENFYYHLVLSEPSKEDLEKGWPSDDPIKTAFLFKAFEKGQLQKMDEPEDCLYYVCGPPMHNKSILKLLDDYGVCRSSIILDDFGS